MDGAGDKKRSEVRSEDYIEEGPSTETFSNVVGWGQGLRIWGWSQG